MKILYIIKKITEADCNAHYHSLPSGIFAQNYGVRNRNSGGFFDTRTVLTLESRPFAFYYTLQRMVAFNVSRDRNQRIGIALVAVAKGLNNE